MNISECRNLIIEYFEKGISAEKQKLLGAEFEYFVVNSENWKSYDYYGENGLGHILQRLMDLEWKPFFEEKGKVLGLEKSANKITLEPGGQIEFSLKPFSHICDIVKHYLSIYSELQSILKKERCLLASGYNPCSGIDQVRLLPSRRYEMMFDYLGKQGENAHHMMKGTAATQVSIDYHSEKDFTKKIRTANFLSPFFSRIFDASPVFENSLFNGDNLRIKIWNNMDKARSGIIPGVLDKNFTFKDYADYILNIPPIYLKRNNDFIYTGGRKFKDLIEETKCTESDINHCMGMCFPDVRVKSFIEIRMADALPYPYNLSVPAMIKGIFYDEKNLEKYFRISQSFNNQDIINIKNKLQSEIDFKYKNLDINYMTESLFNDAKSGLSNNETQHLQLFEKYIRPGHSFSRYLKKLYLSDRNLFFRKCSNNFYEITEHEKDQ